MAILTVGGEADCFLLWTGAFVNDNTAGRFDADASRTSLVIEQGVSEYQLPIADAPTELYVHMYLYVDGVAADDFIFFYGDLGDAIKITLESDGRWSFYKYISDAYTLLATTTNPVLVDAAGAIDIYINISAVGTIRLSLDGTEILLYEGDTTGDSSYFSDIVWQGASGMTANLSQVIVADADTIGMKLVTLPVTGAGAISDWTGNYSNIDEADLNEADFISALEVDTVSVFQMTDIPSAFAGYAALAFAVAMTGNNPADTFIGNIQAAVRPDSTVFYSGDSTTLAQDGITTGSVFVFNQDPSTSAAWTKARVNGTQIGVKSVAGE